MPRANCTRCGLLVSTSRGYKRTHDKICIKLPLPEVLYKRWLIGVSFNEMSEDYGVSHQSIKRRVGVVRTPERDKLRTGNGQRVPNKTGKPVCNTCKMLISLAPVGSWNTCGWCLNGEPILPETRQQAQWSC